jgi:hypothetical protein
MSTYYKELAGVGCQKTLAEYHLPNLNFPSFSSYMFFKGNCSNYKNDSVVKSSIASFITNPSVTLLKLLPYILPIGKLRGT